MESEHSERTLSRLAGRLPMTHPAWEIVDIVGAAPSREDCPAAPQCVDAVRRHARVNHWQRWANRGVDRYRAEVAGSPNGTKEDPRMDMLT